MVIDVGIPWAVLSRQTVLHSGGRRRSSLNATTVIIVVYRRSAPGWPNGGNLNLSPPRIPPRPPAGRGKAKETIPPPPTPAPQGTPPPTADPPLPGTEGRKPAGKRHSQRGR